MDDSASPHDVSGLLPIAESERSDTSDRLSELPDALILVILSLLPMRDVVRTTILSKRWKDLWTTVPCLNFEDDTNDLLAFQIFVCRALISRKRSKILKFGVDFRFDLSCTYALDFWLNVAMKYEVEELFINLIGSEGMTFATERKYSAPPHLFACSSIRKLSLLNCNLEIDGDLQWNQLKSLRIEGVCLSEHVINQVLLGAPQLEVLILRLVESHENLNIQSSSLKQLMIEKSLVENYIIGTVENGAMDTALTIWAPNVETLEISGVAYSECLLMNVSSLTNATLSFYGQGYYKYGRFTGCELLETMLSQVLECISRVKKVTLSNWCIKVLGEMKKKDMLAPLSNAKFLELHASEIDELVGLPEIFPKLTTLVLELNDLWIHESHHFAEKLFHDDMYITDPVVPKFDMENSFESTTSFPKTSLMHLRTVKITWIARDASIYPFIEFLLKHASKLDKLIFRITGIMSIEPESLFLAEQKLLRMPRSSPTAEVILCKD